MSFPRQSARTRRFTLGVPRGFQIAPDGSRVVFLRSRGGTDPVTCLWTLDVATGEERLIADPRTLDTGEARLPAEERARRERARESAGGIVGYATDRDMRLAAFTLAGQLFVADLEAETVRALDAAAPVFDPRPDPAGRQVAYVSGRTVRVIELGQSGGRNDRALVQPESDQVSYGLAEFIAAEEMGRMRGHWWAPDGGSLLVARVDETPVGRWHIADPAEPASAPTEIAYPAAGTPNAYVGLVLLTVDGRRTGVAWDRGEFPYLVNVRWDERGPLIVVQSRDQRVMRLLSVDPSNGDTGLVHISHDPVWVDIVSGVPARTKAGELVWTTDDHESDTRRLTVGGTAVTPAGLQVRAVLSVDGDTVLFSASEEPTEIHVWSYSPDGLTRLTEGSGVFSGSRSGGSTVLTGSRLDHPDVITWVAGSDVKIASLAESPMITPSVELVRAGGHAIRTAVVLPTGWEPGAGRLPVLMDPYGGPHAQRVVAAQRAYREAQWLADQGFAVVIADGRGTPGRGPGWERTIRGDFVGPVLEDQIAALEEAARLHPDALDLDRVGIRGWSFGGWLAALAVLRRPDVFHAGVAGAPVTDWALYDTHYTERYLGHPGEEPETYARHSLLSDAPKLERPLLIIHGLADDNVVAAHTLRLSAALLAAGRPHTVLPLSGVTHMTPQEVVAENLLHLQVDFLRKSLS
ncbi:prolyl oligopeptidase family serine peptidase [Actinomadura sp. HBU206391]|uniref:S9 family peptidase n=1 Tax=Actinomadura sp. HBU206391 TaxID=2731692 RepID=UPI0016503224|nr:prolyl oligopeptidase family serine peptidase [Actinomadura sp. HBU206391]MBC6457784.1 prolyl oligopeptidase family serine peptidase [Actinomadura sp. HBU206391]